jgi:hypothetical protein
MRRVQNRAHTTKTINSSYRSTAAQAVLFKENYTSNYALSAKFDRKRWNGTSYWRRKGNTVSVAVPGTSKHNQGVAFDVQTSSPLQGTLINKHAQHGFYRPWNLVKVEPWHWEYTPGTDVWRTQIRRNQTILSLSLADNYGTNTDKANRALRDAAKNGNYGKTDAEQRYLQARVGVKVDGDIGPKTKVAVKEHVKQFQSVLKALGLYSGALDGKWYSGTERAYQTYRKIGYTP